MRWSIFAFYLLLNLVFTTYTTKAQGYSQVVLTDIPFEPSITIKKEIKERLEQSPVFQSADPISRSFMYWVNYSRLYPKEFRDSALIPYLQQQPRLKGKYANSLLETLDKANALPFLDPEEKLSKAARDHAKDIKRNGGIVSHRSSDGSSFGDRMRKVGYRGCTAENISLGKDNWGLSSLLLLYLDINLPDLGHRKNLLNPNYSKMGISSLQLDGDQTLIVQELGCEETIK